MWHCFLSSSLITSENSKFQSQMCGWFEKMYFSYLDIVLFGSNTIGVPLNSLLKLLPTMTSYSLLTSSKCVWMTRAHNSSPSANGGVFSRRKLQKHAKLIKNILFVSFFSNNSDLMCKFVGVRCTMGQCWMHCVFGTFIICINTNARIVCSFSDVRFLEGIFGIFMRVD